MKKISLLVGVLIVLIFASCVKEDAEPCDCNNTTDTVYVNTTDTTVINGDTVYVNTTDTVIITDTVYVNNVKPTLYGLWQIWSQDGNDGYDYKVYINTEQWKLDWDNNGVWDNIYDIEVGTDEEWFKLYDTDTGELINLYTVEFDEETEGLIVTHLNTATNEPNVNRYRRY